MNTEKKIYTIECYQYNTDKNRKIRVMNGTVESNRDFLTPCCYWFRDFYAANRKEANKKGRELAKALTQSENKKHQFIN